MKTYTDIHGNFMGFTAFLMEDSDFLDQKINKNCKYQSKYLDLSAEAKEWIDLNITYYEIQFGYNHAFVFIPDLNERFVFKLRWYK